MLHISTPLSYPFPIMIYGATYPGVPHAVVISCLSKKRANPKSLILIIAFCYLEA